MATISARTRADGTVSYTAQIRIRRKGAIIYQESKTFDQKKPAERWARKREAFIDSEGIESLIDDLSIGEACKRYTEEVSKLPRGIGRSKKGALQFMQKQEPLAQLQLVGHTSEQLMTWLTWRSDSGAAPSTIAQDAIYLKQVLEYARSAWGKSVDLMPLEDIKKLATKHGIIDRSEAIERRPTRDELDSILKYFDTPKSGSGTYEREHRITPMFDIILFQIFSARRVAETCRIEWADLDHENQRVLVRDMKHPRKKEGNHKWVHLPDRAWKIVQAQPKDNELIFPFNPRSIGEFFRRACNDMSVAVEGLRLHDLRHEGTSHYFELGWDIPRVAMVTGHGSWDNLKRYTHLTQTKEIDKYADWKKLTKY